MWWLCAPRNRANGYRPTNPAPVLQTPPWEPAAPLHTLLQQLTKYDGEAIFTHRAYTCMQPRECCWSVLGGKGWPWVGYRPTPTARHQRKQPRQEHHPRTAHVFSSLSSHFVQGAHVTTSSRTVPTTAPPGGERWPTNGSIRRVMSGLLNPSTLHIHSICHVFVTVTLN